MEVWLVFFLFLFGLCVGSFLNVLIYRLPHNLSIAGRSFCPKCRKKISWYDNIPILSFILLRGECRSCHSPISFYYPAIELVTGFLFVFTVFFFPDESIKYQVLSIKYTMELIYYLFIVSALIMIFFTDLKHGIIPDKIIFSSIFISLFYFLLIHNSLFMIHLLSAFGAFIFFLLLFLITKGKGMGFGDVKLAFLMGIILGFPKIIVALYIAFLTGALLSLILVLCRKKGLKDTVPFGPYLVLATLALFFFGDLISNFFLSVLR